MTKQAQASNCFPKSLKNKKYQHERSMINRIYFCFVFLAPSIFYWINFIVVYEAGRAVTILKNEIYLVDAAFSHLLSFTLFIIGNYSSKYHLRYMTNHIFYLIFIDIDKLPIFNSLKLSGAQFSIVLLVASQFERRRKSIMVILLCV